MRKAFTLLEVIIAAMIITFMGIGILQLESNTTHNLTILEKQKVMTQFSSSMLSQPDVKHHNKNQNLYTFLKDRYIIDYSPLITLLKKEKVHFTQKEVSAIKLNLTKEKAEQTGSIDANIPDFTLLIKENKLQKSSQSAKTLTFKLAK